MNCGFELNLLVPPAHNPILGRSLDGNDDCCIPVAKCYLRYMGQPVKLTDALVLDARLIGELAKRSIAGQIEYWANLGRAIEPLLQGKQALALCKKASARPLSECLETVDTPEGKGRVKAYLETQPYPHYEQAKEAPGLLVRIEADGKRTTGRFVNRKFQPVKLGARKVAHK